MKRGSEAALERSPLRIGVIGAGYIAQFHLAALSRRPDRRVVAVCDPCHARAQALQRRWNVEAAFDSIDAMLDGCELDVIHVVAPPDVHAPAAQQCLESGAHVFLEKPAVTSAAEGRKLVDAANRRGRRVGVNHNMLFHPAFVQLTEAVRACWFGRIRHVTSYSSMPLRQLQSGQYDHWMFRATGNVLLEQGVHPLSQLVFLLGKVRDIAVTTSPHIELPTGVKFFDNWRLLLDCARGSATCTLDFARGFPQNWIYVAGEDGAGWADFTLNTFSMMRHSRFSSPLDECVRGLRTASGLAGQSARQFGSRVLNMLTGRPDVFAQTIQSSIDAFYGSLNDDGEQDVTSCVHLIDVCERVDRLAQEGAGVPAMCIE